MTRYIILIATIISIFFSQYTLAETWEGELDYDGKQHGLWTRYTDDSVLWETVNYRHGVIHGVRTGYFPNGNPSSEMDHRDGVPFGQFTSYYDNEAHSLNEQGENADGKRTGRWLAYYPNQQPKSSTNYYNGELNGSAEYFYASGGKQIAAQMRNNVFHGSYIEYYDNANNSKKSEGEFVDGNRSGEWVTWHSNENKSAVTNYYLGELMGEDTQFFVSGVRQNTKTYRRNLLHGRYMSFYDVNYFAKEFDGMYLDNLQHGLWEHRARNGNLIEEISWDRGTRSGMNTIYHETDGVVDRMLPYVDGKLQGEFRSFFHEPLEEGVAPEDAPLPQVSEQGNYRNNQKSGLWNSYFENGEIRLSTMWGGDLRNGIETEYSIDVGTFTDTRFVSRTTTWAGNKQEGQETLFYPDRSTKLTGRWFNDYPVGEFIRYHPNGEKSDVGSYVDGLQEGFWREYNDDGVLITVREFLNDELVQQYDNCDLPGFECPGAD